VAREALANTLKLADINPDEFDAVFYPGGHGPLWDLAEDSHSAAIIETLYTTGKPVAAVCHAPAVFRLVRDATGAPLVQGKEVTGFSNAEEAAVGLTGTVPFLVEDMLRQRGGKYSQAAEWEAHVITDGNLITGQNPASSAPAARALLRQLSN
jgi:putative intracellular protease/amidase